MHGAVIVCHVPPVVDKAVFDPLTPSNSTARLIAYWNLRSHLVPQVL